MVEGAGYCAQHQAGEKKSSPPTTILLKPRINQNWLAKLQRVGVTAQMRDDAALNEKHRAEAASLGRSATAYRPTADSGVPVFGKDGAVNVSVTGLLDELEAQGYRVTGLHYYQRAWKDTTMANLVVGLELLSEEVSSLWADNDVQEIVRSLLEGAAWGHAHVWDNPPKEDGSTVCTVNLSHRDAAEPVCCLVYDEGYWNLQ